MIWLPVVGIAVLAFAFAALVLRLPRQGYTLLGATLLFGLAGYALQGSPGQPASPGAGPQEKQEIGTLMVDTRRRLYDTVNLPSRFLLTSDAFARRGDEVNAAGFANSAVIENPRDGEAWTALGNALSEHADGRMTPAARYAFEQGRAAAPGTPAPAFFLGFALLRDGKPEEARKVWAELLASAPADAPWRAELADRIAMVDRVISLRRE